MVQVDKLFKNANVLTLDQENSQANVVASYKGKITGVWNKEDFERVKR